MKSPQYYLTLSLYPVGLFAFLGALQFIIFFNSYSQQADRQLEPYVNNQPIPEVTKKIDRRPQSINLPTLDPTTAPKGDRSVTPTP